MHYTDDAGALRVIRQSFTSAAAEDPFVKAAAGRSAFRVSDLLGLAALLDNLEGDDRTVRENEVGVESVKEILPNM